jgi:hypothetical protein
MNNCEREPVDGAELERTPKSIEDSSEAYGPYASIVFLSNSLMEKEDGLTQEETKGLSFMLALLADDARDSAEREALETAE